jgi:hypothetical protein
MCIAARASGQLCSEKDSNLSSLACLDMTPMRHGVGRMGFDDRIKNETAG